MSMVSVTDLHIYLACLVAETDDSAVRSQCRLKRVYTSYPNSLPIILLHYYIGQLFDFKEEFLTTVLLIFCKVSYNYHAEYELAVIKRVSYNDEMNWRLS